MNKLKEYRILRSLTQEELSNESGISIRTIQRIEKELSIGSSHTIKTLAKTLNIESDNLLASGKHQNELITDELNKIKLINLSILTVIFFPFGNLIFSTIIFLKNKKNKKVNTLGRKIISLQILNTLTMFFLTIILFITLGRGNEVIPLPVSISYLLYAFTSCILVIYTAISLNNKNSPLKFVPSLI